MEKTCKVCATMLPLSEFYQNRKTADGYLSACKSCQDEANRRIRATPSGRLNQYVSNLCSRRFRTTPAAAEARNAIAKAAEELFEMLGVEDPRPVDRRRTRAPEANR